MADSQQGSARFDAKQMFRGLVAVILLGLYVHLIRVGLKVVNCLSTAGCTEYTTGHFNDGMAQALSVIGGLVSALVIAELAITKRGEAPFARELKNARTTTSSIVQIVATFYVLVWIVAGLWVFVVGLYHPKELPALTTLGQAWLGLAVAAAYAYFGLEAT